MEVQSVFLLESGFFVGSFVGLLLRLFLLRPISASPIGGPHNRSKILAR